MKENKEMSNTFIGKDGKLIEKSEDSLVGKEGMLKKEKRDFINEMKDNYTFDYLSRELKRQWKEKEDLKEIIKRTYNMPGILFSLKGPRDHLLKKDEKNGNEKFKKEVENLYDYFCKIAENEEEFEKYWNYIQNLE